ncbi:MAG: DUF3099 domain-containing protein [Actinomycetes bacterium]
MGEEIHNITSAQQGLSDDLPGRQRRYFISMMIRTACFIGSIFTPNPFRWFLIFGAIVLPYVSVVIANAGRERSSAGTSIINDAQKSIS